MNNKKLWPKLNTNDLGNSFRLLNSTRNLRSRRDAVAALLALHREKQKRTRMDVPPPKQTRTQGAIRAHRAHGACLKRDMHRLFMVCLKVIAFWFTHTHTLNQTKLPTDKMKQCDVAQDSSSRLHNRLLDLQYAWQQQQEQILCKLQFN